MSTTGAARDVVLGVSGGIAAYKACYLLRLLTESGHRVRVVPTAAALRFVGAPTWEALSGQPVGSEVFEDVHEVPHVRIGQHADLVVVAPATADLLARAAHGIADDLLTNTLLTARCPVLFVPAMHTEMWTHPATVANVATLRERGALVLDPASGRLTGADTGPGRLPEPELILAHCQRLLSGTGPPAQDLAGRRVLVSAGGTREPLDPVRYLGNRSTGMQGYALAAAARARGAEVVLVAANAALHDGGTLADPGGVQVVLVHTALELEDAVLAHAGQADVVVMAAAVADFRPAEVSATKIKKTHEPGTHEEGLMIALVRNPDILADLAQHRRRPGQLVVGFAAETGDTGAGVLELGAAKLARKRCDLLVVNEVGPGKAFGTSDNTVTILGADGSATHVGPTSKGQVADAVWDAVAARLE